MANFEREFMLTSVFQIFESMYLKTLLVQVLILLIFWYLSTCTFNELVVQVDVLSIC